MRKPISVTALSLTLLTYGGCATSPKNNFDPKALQAYQKEQAAGYIYNEMAPLPESIERIARNNPPKITETGKIPEKSTKIKLAEIIHRAVVNNLDVRVESYQSAIDRARVLEAEANFDPKWVISNQYQHQYVNGTIYSNMTPTELYSNVLSTGIKQSNDLGGSYSIMLQNQKQRYFSQESLSTVLSEQKSWDEQVVLQITQPLLKDFGTDVNRARIVIARNDQKISQLDLQKKLEDVIQKAEETYWKLVQADQDVVIQEEQISLAEKTLDTVVKRSNDASDLQINPVRSDVESRRVELVRARLQRVSYSDDLKKLMNDPDYPISGPTLLLPSDKPVAVPVQLNLADQIETAFSNRVELLQQSLRIDSAKVVIKAAKNNLLPKLDISASVGYEGINRTFAESWDSFDDGHTINWGIGFQFEVPIGNRAAEAIWRRTQLQHFQSIDEWRRQADQVAGEVLQAMRSLELSWEISVAAQRSVFAAEDALKSFQTRDDDLSPSFVRMLLDRQTALSQAKSTLNAALTSYNQSLSDLEKAKGTILKYNSIEMREGAPVQTLKK